MKNIARGMTLCMNRVTRIAVTTGSHGTTLFGPLLLTEYVDRLTSEF